MTEKANTNYTAERTQFQAEFDALPLDEKFARLFKMEAATIGETINYVADHSAKAFEKFTESLNEFGRKAKADCAAAEETAEAAVGSDTSKPKGGKAKK